MPAKKKSPEKYTLYHKDGTIWAKGEKAVGEMVGYWEWFRKDGTKMRSGHFENGKQVGEWITYNSKGHVVKVTKMKLKSKA
jgi:antitoxin component YwqK of YwqJK toxin-antitoxin module